MSENPRPCVVIGCRSRDPSGDVALEVREEPPYHRRGKRRPISRPFDEAFRSAGTTLEFMTRQRVRIAIVGINYAPESIGIAPYTTLLASGLAARGHEVQVLTGFPHYPEWARRDGTFRFRSEEVENLVHIGRFGHYVPRRATTSGRVAMETTFGLQVLLARWNEPEVVLVVSPPLLAAGISAVRARLSRPRPAIGVIVHDLYGRGGRGDRGGHGQTGSGGARGGGSSSPAGGRGRGDPRGGSQRFWNVSASTAAGSAPFGTGTMSRRRILRRAQRSAPQRDGIPPRW